ncbi:MAG: hypothetical protein IPK26_05690 [Planctomycetes bacterium]|nr:hypothetical protein [Planctomycetota bacterium]
MIRKNWLAHIGTASLTLLLTGIVGRFTSLFAPRIEPTDRVGVAIAFLNDPAASKTLMQTLADDERFRGRDGGAGPKGDKGDKGDPSDFAKSKAEQLSAALFHLQHLFAAIHKRPTGAFAEELQLHARDFEKIVFDLTNRHFEYFQH